MTVDLERATQIVGAAAPRGSAAHRATARRSSTCSRAAHAAAHACPRSSIVRDGLAQSTVYRNLVVLEEAGIVHRIVATTSTRASSSPRISPAHHHHLVCLVVRARSRTSRRQPGSSVARSAAAEIDARDRLPHRAPPDRPRRPAARAPDPDRQATARRTARGEGELLARLRERAKTPRQLARDRPGPRRPPSPRRRRTRSRGTPARPWLTKAWSRPSSASTVERPAPLQPLDGGQFGRSWSCSVATVSTSTPSSLPCLRQLHDHGHLGLAVRARVREEQHDLRPAVRRRMAPPSEVPRSDGDRLVRPRRRLARERNRGSASLRPSPVRPLADPVVVVLPPPVPQVAGRGEQRPLDDARADTSFVEPPLRRRSAGTAAASAS